MSDDTDAWVEEEIQRELDALNEGEIESSDPDLTNDLSDASEAQDDDLLPSMQDYFSKVKYQTDKLEAELKECDDLLNESELVSARDANGASEMYLELAVEHGIDPETLRKQVLEELEKEDEENERLLLREDLDEVDVNEEIPTQENELTPEPLENGASIFSTEVHFGLSSDTFGRLERPESNQRGRTAEGADEPSDSLALNADVTEEVVANTENDNDELSNPGQKSSRGDASDTKMAILDSIKPDENKEPALVLGPGQGVVAEVSQFDLLERQALKQLKDITKQRKQKETVWKEEENKRFQTAERIDKENEVKRIDKLTELDKEHKAVLITREEREKKVEAEIKVAQAKYTEELKSYEAEINELAKQAEKEKEEFRIALQEENIKREEKRLNAAVKIQSCYRGHRARATHGEVVKVRIEESKLIREQERITAIETEREGQKRIEQQKMEEEIVKKQHEEEERKRKQEDEIKAKELEEKRKADEKKRKLEEERKKKEEMEMKKAEEERKRAEDRRRKEEEDRWRKQEEERKKEEEKRRKEEEKRQKEEADRKKREEEQKRIEEERTRLEEEKKRREDEERKRLDELKRKEEEERKRKEEEERKIRLEEERRQEEERKKKERHLKQIGKLGPVNGHAADRSVFEDWGECLPLSVEQKRLGWMKECKPWSKTLSELKGKKPSSSKRPPRRPISAKKFPLLDEKSILSGANVATLQQVTTVELSDLPGCSLKTLSQCVSLKSLIMNNCNIVALDGLGDCKTLHYIDIKHNKCEMVNVKDMITLVYLDVSHNCLSNIHGLDGCSSLKYVDMSHNRITRIGGLETLKKLHTFKLSSNQLITTRGLSEAPTVQELDLSNNHLPNVDDIDNLGLLQSLNVSGNNLLQFPKLMNHVLLQRLVLNSNSISNLSSMETAWLPSLTHLEITQNSIASLSDISSACINLQHLNLSHNQILELEPLIAVLSKHRHLQYLSVDGNPAAEEHGAKDSLTLRLGRLVELDSKRTGSKETAINLTTFEKMCKSQVTESANLKSSFARTLKAARMKDYAQVHHKHFTKSNQVAAEHRFAHEYGDMSVKASQEMRQSVEKKPSPSVNPKDSFAEAISQGRALAPTPPQEKPPPKPNQASQMKNKFEEALMNANKPAMEPPTSSVAVRNPQVTANSVGNILKDEGVINQERARNKAATKIQARFRGYSIRKEIEERTQHALAAMEEQDARNRQRMGPPDGAPPEPPLGEKRISIDSTPVTNKAAALIQALWRGYILRKKLMMALSYARFEDMDDDMPDMDIDLNAFEFNEADLDKGWTPPETPQLPKSTPVIGQPVSRTMMETRPPEVPVLYEKPPHPPEQPRQAWRGQSPMHANGKLPPLPPQSRLSEHSEQYTQRTALSKKEEQITEEWGFNNSRTAELMMARAKKLKYNSDKKKKFGKLDPKQRLALFRKLEETTKIKPVQPLSRKQAPRKEYFKAREEEFANQEREKRMEVTTKVDRTFEWVHTQVGSHDIESARDDGHRMSSGGYYSSDNNLPRIENTGRRTVLTASPSLDLQSIESASFTGDVPKPRRLSMQDHGDRLPPIKTSSAPSSRPGERLSWRGKEIKKSGGWGGGKKRTK